MDPVSLAIVTGLAVNLIWLVILYLVGRYAGLFDRRSAYRFWRVVKQGQISAAVSTIPTDATTNDYQRPATGAGELQAYAYVTASLYAARKNRRLKSVYMADRFPSESLRTTVITIGGSQLNQISGLLLERTRLAFMVDNTPPKTVVDCATGERFDSVYRDGQIVEDYGILTRTVNPFANESYSFVLQGAHTYGTAACGRMLHPDYISTLTRRPEIAQWPSWQALIRSVVVGTEVFPELVSVKQVSLIDRNSA